VSYLWGRVNVHKKQLRPNRSMTAMISKRDMLQCRIYVAKIVLLKVTSFRRDVYELCALLGYYAASNGNTLPTFRDIVSVLSSRIKKPWTSWTLKMLLIRCSETSVKDYHSTMYNIPEKRRSYSVVEIYFYLNTLKPNCNYIYHFN
jgi:hypothetical protein